MKRRVPSLNVERWALDVERLPILALCFVAGSSLAQEIGTSGYGPPTSVPVERSTIARAALPPRNWIDQTQREADAKSIGCWECHKGVEPMHKAEQNVVLGCTDCHGGNSSRGLKKEQAHILPRNKEFWNPIYTDKADKDGILRTSSANPPNSNVWLNHESPEFIQFMLPPPRRWTSIEFHGVKQSAGEA